MAREEKIVFGGFSVILDFYNFITDLLTIASKWAIDQEVQREIQWSVVEFYYFLHILGPKKMRVFSVALIW